MGFTGQDDLIAQMTAGKYMRVEMSKLIAPVHTAGGWHMLTGLPGYPNAGAFQAATDLSFQTCTEAGGDGAATPVLIGPQIGGLIGSATRHLVNIGASIVAAAGAPWQLKLVDLQGYYKLSGTNVTGTAARTLVNSATFTASSSTGLLLTYATYDWANYAKVQFTTTGTLPANLALLTDYWLVRQSATTAKVSTSLANAIAGTFVAWGDAGSGTHTLNIKMPRYTNGVGCEACFVVQTQPTAGGPQMSASDYSNTTPASGRVFQGMAGNGLNATANAYATRTLHSGNAAGNYGAFLPKQGGDLGISQINSFTWSAGTAYTGSGVIALCIVKPICDIAIPVTGMWCERDLVNQLPSLPEIKQGACLQWMLFGTGATTTASPVTCTLDLAYGG